MASRLFFSLMYRIGFTPWDGHPLPSRLKELTTGADALPRGRAIELGCGTGDTAIHLSKSGFSVTGIDFVQRALDRAKKKARDAGVDVRFVRADVTKLSEYGVGDDFSLIVDGGCLHGIPHGARDAYVREVTKIAAPGARLLMLAFDERRRRGPPGVGREEIDRRFGAAWTVLGSAPAADISRAPGDPIHVHELERKSGGG